MFRHTAATVSLYVRQTPQTLQGTLIAAFDDLYVRTLESYGYAKFFPHRPKITHIDQRKYAFDNGWVIDLDDRSILETIPSHRNVQKHFARDAARLVFDHKGFRNLELIDYNPYHNQILQFYSVADSTNRYLAYINFWSSTAALLSRDCEQLIECVYASNSGAPALSQIGNKHRSIESIRKRWDKGKPRGQ